MIKTEYYDDDFNEVAPEDAKLIIQLFYDDQGKLLKKIHWAPQKKTGYPRSVSQINEDVHNEFLSQNIKHHYLENVLGMQRAIDLLWRYNGEVREPLEKQKFLQSIIEGYYHMAVGLSNLRHVLREDKGGCGH